MARRLPLARVLVRTDVSQACGPALPRRADHTEGPSYDHNSFKPWRIHALAFKAIRRLYPEYPIWRDFAYEYEQGKLPIDVINGGPVLREWVDDASAIPQDLDKLALPDEQAWSNERQRYLRYETPKDAYSP